MLCKEQEEPNAEEDEKPKENPETE